MTREFQPFGGSMELWEEHKSWVLIPALPLASWVTIRSYSTSLRLDSFACEMEIKHMTSPNTCHGGSRNPHSPSLPGPVAPLILLSDLLPSPLPLLTWAPHQEGSPKPWQRPFPAPLCGWAHSLPCLVLPVSFLTPSAAPGQRQEPRPNPIALL